ncbi:unnamed protein product [Amoebophrya sp. A25]|nr:unnamed protein product [Amoebophrya sp. A25]|eukprot:GSA25T00003109001.1
MSSASSSEQDASEQSAGTRRVVSRSDWDRMVKELTPSPIIETVKLVCGSLLLVSFGWYSALNMAICVGWEALDKRTVKMVPLLQICSNFSTLAETHGPSRRYDLDEGVGAKRCGWIRYTDISVARHLTPVLVLLRAVACLRLRLFFSACNSVQRSPVGADVLQFHVRLRTGAQRGASEWKLAAALASLSFERNKRNLQGICCGDQIPLQPLGRPFSRCRAWRIHVLTRLQSSQVQQWIPLWDDEYYSCYRDQYPDVYCTLYRPRDSFANFVRYLPCWLSYSTNLSTIYAFCQEGRYRWATHVALYTSAYWAFVAVCVKIAPLFALSTIVFAFFEASTLLALVNLVWHGFVDERDPSNEYVNSTTIVDGLNFTLKEEYHVVHHQYPGAHWTKHEELYEKHLNSYTLKALERNSNASPGGSLKKTTSTEVDIASTKASESDASENALEEELSSGSTSPDRLRSRKEPSPSSKQASDKKAPSSSSYCRSTRRGGPIIATGFEKENLFEIFGMMCAQDYMKLASLFYQPFNSETKFSQEELAELIKTRLRAHGPELALRTAGIVPDVA